MTTWDQRDLGAVRTADLSDGRTRRRWLHTLTAASLIGWGGLHVVGGVALIAESRQGAGGALAVLGSAVALSPDQAPAGDTARVAAALVGFHGLNVAVAGAAVVLLAILGRRRRRRDAIAAALVVAAVMDSGLTVFLLVPGLMSPADGAAGLVLLAAAMAATAATGLGRGRAG